jgi:hypothetical protein
MADRVFKMYDGWYCLVAGRTYGPWACKAYATAGMQVEQRRARIRLSRQSDNSFTEWFNANFGEALS